MFVPLKILWRGTEAQWDEYNHRLAAQVFKQTPAADGAAVVYDVGVPSGSEHAAATAVTRLDDHGLASLYTPEPTHLEETACHSDL